jgi:hypothetical protein
MIRLIVFSAVLAVATSAEAMSPAPLHQPDGMITQVICGPGQVRSKTGNCVWKTTNPNRPTSRAKATAVVWHGAKAFAFSTAETPLITEV